MGLDNGIVIKSKRNINFPPELTRVSDCSEYALNTGYPHEYEICYWRKCWNVRRAIGLTLGTDMNEDASKANLTLRDIKNIWHALNYLNHKRVWEEGDSIWSYREARRNLDDCLLTLEWLIQYIREHEDDFGDEFFVEFYDSY